MNFYDGMIRVVGPDGREHAKYHARDYREYVAERVEPWSYLKFPYLKKVGWKGLVDGAGFRRLQGHAAVAIERRRRHGHAAGPGRVREVLRRRWAASPSTIPWPPTGPG